MPTISAFHKRMSCLYILSQVYLDNQHVDWMTDNVLQHVLADLQPKILPKLKAEADVHSGSAGVAAGKKATVDTHRGDSYQFCYFIRKTEPHSVLIKTRHFSAAPPQQRPNMPPPPPPKPQGSKRKGRKPTTPISSNKRRKTKGKGKAREGDESDDAISSAEEEVVDAPTGRDEAANPRRSQRTKKVVGGGYQQNHDFDVEMEDQPQNSDESIQVKDEVDEFRLTQPQRDSGAGDAATPIDIDLEIEEEKPKPVLQLKYQDFSIYSHCLCIVVEPYPPLRSASRTPSASRARSVAFFAPRGQSTTPAMATAPSAASSLRARTPLFLPDDDDREGSVAPFPRQSTLPPVPLFQDQDDEEEPDSDNGGMIAFSQAMNGANHLPAGAADDDDEMDGAVYFGDADEVREL
ncbi:hypothetical protein B0H11DRAFT_1969358 [Mycena galericulata]|nr:hypothetical protein B0H11DRAFT_1969358 [Mycena galericulata]